MRELLWCELFVIHLPPTTLFESKFGEGGGGRTNKYLLFANPIHMDSLDSVSFHLIYALMACVAETYELLIAAAVITVIKRFESMI